MDKINSKMEIFNDFDKIFKYLIMLTEYNLNLYDCNKFKLYSANMIKYLKILSKSLKISILEFILSKMAKYNL